MSKAKIRSVRDPGVPDAENPVDAFTQQLRLKLFRAGVADRAVIDRAVHGQVLVRRLNELTAEFHSGPKAMAALVEETRISQPDVQAAIDASWNTLRNYRLRA